ncbi:MAG: 30S ribosomal protein S20 [Eubacteriales bacterium]|nr:30S ribosomal protein S20 [Eubacteriales bacterium]
MPNIKSAIKRVRTTKTKTANNASAKSKLKTIIKKSREASAAGNDNAETSLKAAYKAVDQAAAKNLMHKNTAARRKSSLAKEFNKNKKQE